MATGKGATHTVATEKGATDIVATEKGATYTVATEKRSVTQCDNCKKGQHTLWQLRRKKESVHTRVSAR